ncbi:acyclic terpene utilization AtuA family protein [Seohaeicola zhoushanensis]|uniref:ABC transporter substrate-binding protein n=1 Tax=Seohaeicola zhoushanensis TaxID=1569283 RepID=A0A8J3H1I9_9RHOB|nr:acyclic terpene utilization AtuA family protein [Seohaeicola zhoushanensis]GHF67286.1 ABC transporter substrate-binding protein [Seohaeicola zhoushanensis]
MALRIGCGSGGAPDRVAPAEDLARDGALDYLCFESLAERTLAQGHVARRAGSAGYSGKLDARLRAVLPHCVRNGTRVLTNMGAADPLGAGEATARLAAELGLSLKIAVIEGDDVLGLITPDTRLEETGGTVESFGRTPVAANAYIGHEAMVEALAGGADVVIAGRVSDSSLFLAPIAHELKIAPDDWDMLARGALVGHLLECSTQITGGYFADPGYKDVPGLDNLGYPLAEVDPDGSAVITKLAGTGGCVTPLTVKEQLLYEVHDPAAYLTPDVSANFTTVRIAEEGPDRIRVSAATGAARPDRLKALVAFDGGYLAEGEIGYAGPGALDRARLAAEVVRKRMTLRNGFNGELRFDLIGATSLHATAGRASESEDIRLRGALRSMDRRWADMLLEEIESLWMGGPAGGGGFRGRVTPSVITQPTFVNRADVRCSVRWIDA